MVTESSLGQRSKEPAGREPRVRSDSIHGDQEVKSDVFTIISGLNENNSEKQQDQIETPKTSSSRRSCSHKIVAMTGACFNVMVGMGFPFAVAALYIEMINNFNASRGQAAVIQSLTVGVLFGTGIIAGAVVDRFGVRVTAILGGALGFLGLFSSWFATQLIHLMITIGVITGFGSSLIYMSTSVIVASVFDKGRRLAMPGLICAAGIGSVMFPEILDRLLKEYGLRGTLLLTSCLYLNTIVFGLVITSHLECEKTKPLSVENSKQTSVREKFKFLRNPSFIIYVITTSITFGSVNGLGVVLLDFLQYRGYSSKLSLNVLLIFNSINTVSRLVSGFFSLIPKVKGTVIFSAWLFLCSTSLILLRYTTEFSTTLTLIVIYSIGFGGLMGIFPYSILEFVGQELFPLALGFSGLFNGSANPVGSASMGLMYDLTKSYDLPFLVFGIVGNSSALITLLATSNITLYRPCRKKLFVIQK